MVAVEPGLYETTATFKLMGAWDILVTAKRGENEFNTPKRLGVGMDFIP